MGERWECRRRSNGVVAVVVAGQGLAPETRVSWVLKHGEDVVEEEDGGHHGYKEQQAQTHGETHRTFTPIDFNGFAYFCQNPAKPDLF
jgi:hypothetical protein